jgi:hypothetical protein
MSSSLFPTLFSSTAATMGDGTESFLFIRTVANRETGRSSIENKNITDADDNEFA